MSCRLAVRSTRYGVWALRMCQPCTPCSACMYGVDMHIRRMSTTSLLLRRWQPGSRVVRACLLPISQGRRYPPPAHAHGDGEAACRRTNTCASGSEQLCAAHRAAHLLSLASPGGAARPQPPPGQADGRGGGETRDRR